MPTKKTAARKAPARRARTARRGSLYLVVRGSGNTVYVAKAGKPIRDAKIAKAVDAFRATKSGGVVKPPRAFVATTDGLHVMDNGIQLHIPDED